MSEESKSILDAATGKMEKAISFFQEELLSIRAGKASQNVLNGVSVNYYGSQVPISQVASVNIPDAKTILIQPWEKTLIPTIEKAIMVASRSNTGEPTPLSTPPLTEERRLQLVKQVKAEGETARVSLRNARRDAVEAFKKAQKDGMPEDMAKDGEADAQKLIDRFNKKLEEMIAEKEQEIMTV